MGISKSISNNTYIILIFLII